MPTSRSLGYAALAKSRYLNELSAEAMDALITLNEASPSHHSTLDVWQLGGALSRVPPQNTAFGDRSAPYLIGIEANWERPEDDAACIEWGREVFRVLEPFSSDREYFNFPGLYEDGDQSVRDTFGANLGRLQSVKRKYDPDNLFRLNHNITARLRTCDFLVSYDPFPGRSVGPIGGTGPHSEGGSVSPTSGQPLVRLEAVSKSYGSGSSKLDVLDQIALDLPQGETTSLVGRSGSGKSTLLSLIAGLMRPDTGHIYIGGHQMDQLDDNGRASLRAERIGFVLQSDNLIPFLTAVENVELALGFASGRRPTARARELLVDLGLGHRMDHLPRQLSGGESQRVAVAVALANEPDLLLADEVVGQLDSTTAADVMEMIFTASRERNLTVLYVTHDEQLARQADRSLRLTDHKVVRA